MCKNGTMTNSAIFFLSFFRVVFFFLRFFSCVFFNGGWGKNLGSKGHSRYTEMRINLRRVTARLVCICPDGSVDSRNNQSCTNKRLFLSGLQNGGATLLLTGSALLCTDLLHLTNGIWEIHAGCSCFLHPPFLAKFGSIP